MTDCFGTKVEFNNQKIEAIDTKEQKKKKKTSFTVVLVKHKNVLSSPQLRQLQTSEAETSSRRRQVGGLASTAFRLREKNGNLVMLVHHALFFFSFSLFADECSA